MSTTPDALRDAAYKSIKDRRDFWPHLIAYVTINAMLVVVWAVASPDAIFWPAVPMAGWGIGILFHAWAAFFGRPITDVDVDRELARWRSRDGGTRVA